MTGPFYCMDCGRKQSKRVYVRAVTETITEREYDYRDGCSTRSYPVTRYETVGSCRKCGSKFIHQLDVARGELSTYGAFMQIDSDSSRSPALLAEYWRRGGGDIGGAFAHAYDAVREKVFKDKRQALDPIQVVVKTPGPPEACDPLNSFSTAGWKARSSFLMPEKPGNYNTLRRMAGL